MPIELLYDTRTPAHLRPHKGRVVMSEISQSPGTNSGAVTTVAAGDPADRFLIRGRPVEAGRGWDWIASAFALFKKQPGIWILLLLVYFACYIAIALVPLFIGGIANLVLTPVFGAGIMLGCKALEEGGKLEIGQLFAGFKRNTSNLVVLGVLTLVGWVAVLLVVSLVIGGGSFWALLRGDAAGFVGLGITLLLAILVGLALATPLYMALWFAPALIALNDIAPVEAMKASFSGCLKNIVPFLVYGVVVIVLTVIAAIPFGLGLLILVPVVVASIYTGYRDVFYQG
jgi:hypothetical protein